MHLGLDWARTRAFLAVLLAALLVQGVAVQAHIHFARQNSSAVLTHGDSVQLAKPGKPGDAVNCPLCQEAAMAGAYLLPPSIVLPPVAATIPLVPAAAIVDFDLLTPVRGWLSRAPPR